MFDTIDFELPCVMSHITQSRKPLLARVRRIQGQAAALEIALSQGKDCAAVLQQIAAIRGAVNGLMAQVLEGHLRDHLSDPAASAEQREDELAVVLSVLKSYLK